VLPLVVSRPLTAGADAAVTVTRSADPSADVPAGEETVTSQTPAGSGGTVTVMVASSLTAKSLAAMPPKLTPLAPVNPDPVMIRVVPPAVPSALVLSELIEGAEAAS